MIFIFKWNYKSDLMENLSFKVQSYRSEPLCVALYKKDDLRNPVTMNLGHFIGPGKLMPEYGCYLNASHPDYKNVKAFIDTHGIGKPVIFNNKPVLRESGFYQYPLYILDSDKLKAMDPNGCARYEQGYRLESCDRYIANKFRSEIIGESKQLDVSSGPEYW